MIELEAAQKKVLSLCEPLTPKKAQLADALDRVAAEDIFAQEKLPAFDNSAMDGFALRAEDVSSPPARLEIIGEIRAGDSPAGSSQNKAKNKLGKELAPGQAYRIMTGAVMPKSADAVIEVEATDSDGPDHIIARRQVASGSFIRKAGEDISVGDKLAGAGDVLNPARLGVLASQGIYEVSAYPKCRVGVLSTGSELVDDKKRGSKKKPAPGQIRDSNRRILLGLVKKLGIDGKDLGLIPDSEQSIEKAFRAAAKKFDILLTSGGVSMGDFDFVKKILIRQGGEAIQIAIKPSKPLAFGKIGGSLEGRIGGMLVLGLPGNPVSSAVSFELFAKPCIKKMMGHKDPYPKRVTAVLTEDLPRSPDGKTHFVRVLADYTDGKYQISSAGGQGSHMLNVLAGSNGLAAIEDGHGAKTGEEVPLILLD